MSASIDREKIERITAAVLDELRRLGQGGGAPVNGGNGSAALIRPYGEMAPLPSTKSTATNTGPTLRPEEIGASPSGRPTVVCNVSNRHIHLTKPDFEVLFGKGAELTPRNMLFQPGQFAAKETVSLIAGRGRAIENVRILGPLRKYTQVEISRTDGFFLGIRPPVRQSGDTKGSGSGTLIGPKGTLVLAEGIIVADRHIHTPPEVAQRFGLANNQMVRTRVFHTEKPTTLELVRIRISDEFLLEMHIDNDDANAAGVESGSRLEVLL